jgi:sugar phosphate isomerase/epimerase
MLEAIKDHHPHIGVCLDTGHLVRAGDDPVEAVRTLGPRLHGVHMKDYNEQNHDVAIGRGRADLVGFFTALKEADFDGAFSIEYEIDSKNPVPGLAESIASIRAIVSRLA